MADILIKNMEMPRNCEYCPIYDEDYCQCRLEPTYEAHWTRENCCPLVELPSHGRLVDGDKLLAVHNPNENWDYMVLECIIRNAPTVVEATT